MKDKTKVSLVTAITTISVAGMVAFSTDNVEAPQKKLMKYNEYRQYISELNTGVKSKNGVTLKNIDSNFLEKLEQEVLTNN